MLKEGLSASSQIQSAATDDGARRCECVTRSEDDTERWSQKEEVPSNQRESNKEERGPAVARIFG